MLPILVGVDRFSGEVRGLVWTGFGDGVQLLVGIVMEKVVAKMVAGLAWLPYRSRAPASTGWCCRHETLPKQVMAGSATIA